MEIRNTLNNIYKPIHTMGRNLLKDLLDLGYNAKLCYCNMHEVKIDEKYQTEYFPLPEIVISDIAIYADLGISLDLTAWLELTITRETALMIDYNELSKHTYLEVYGANDYLQDFYNEKMCPLNVKDIIEGTDEQQIHLCFYLNDCNIETVKSLMNYLHQKSIISM